MRVIGIDTDVNGSICYLNATNPSKVEVDIWKVPSIMGLRSKNSKTINFTQLCVMAKHMPVVKYVFLEGQTGRPNQSLNSTVTFFEAYGSFQMLGNLIFINRNLSPRVEIVYPSKWKSELQLSGDKQEAKNLATKIAPVCQDAWASKLNTSAAEAFLIAVWGLLSKGVQIDSSSQFLPVEKSTYPEQSLFFGLER